VPAKGQITLLELSFTLHPSSFVLRLPSFILHPVSFRPSSFVFQGDESDPNAVQRTHAHWQGVRTYMHCYNASVS